MKIEPRQVLAFLSSGFYPATIPLNSFYELGSCDGQKIIVSVSGDHDVWIGVWPNIGTMRFRTFFGRGMSLCTRNALLCLAEAFRINGVQGFDSGQDIASACRDVLCGALHSPHDGVYMRSGDDPDDNGGGWLCLVVSGGTIFVDSDWHVGPSLAFPSPPDDASLSERSVYNALVLLVHAIAQDNKTQPQYPLGDG